METDSKLTEKMLHLSFIAQPTGRVHDTLEFAICRLLPHKPQSPRDLVHGGLRSSLATVDYLGLSFDKDVPYEMTVLNLV